MRLIVNSPLCAEEGRREGGSEGKGHFLLLSCYLLSPAANNRVCTFILRVKERVFARDVIQTRVYLPLSVFLFFTFYPLSDERCPFICEKCHECDASVSHTARIALNSLLKFSVRFARVRAPRILFTRV